MKVSNSRPIPALLLTLGLALAAPLLAQAQAYPAKPIRAVVAFGTGVATDLIARIRSRAGP